MTERFMVVGDVHGNTGFAESMCHAAKRFGVDTIYQVGDFGLWDHHKDGVSFLNYLNKISVKCDVKWVWVPGNHENYDSLAAHRAKPGGLDENGFVVLRSNILSTDKALTWTHGDLTFGAVGGAVSIDREYRTEGKSWWPQESTTMEDVTLFKSMLKKHFNTVDVLLTHDAPSNMPTWQGFVKDDTASERNRQAMDMVYSAANARIAFHGHYHRHMAYSFGETGVVGLSCDPSGASYWGGDHRSFALVEYDGVYDVKVFEKPRTPPTNTYLI